VLALARAHPGLCDIPVAASLLGDKDKLTKRKGFKDYRVYDFALSQTLSFVDFTAELGPALYGVMETWHPNFLIIPSHYEQRVAMFIKSVAVEFGTTVYQYEDTGMVKAL
jgi:hypothetical protein